MSLKKTPEGITKVAQEKDEGLYLTSVPLAKVKKTDTKWRPGFQLAFSFLVSPSEELALLAE